MSYSIAFSQALEITSYIAIKSEEQYYEYLSIQKISEKISSFLLKKKIFFVKVHVTLTCIWISYSKYVIKIPKHGLLKYVL